MSALSHELEDAARRPPARHVELTPHVLDLLFRRVELYGRILAVEKEGARQTRAPRWTSSSAQLGRLARRRRGAAGARGAVRARPRPPRRAHRVRGAPPPHQHRSRGCGSIGCASQFQLATIDQALDDLKARAKPHGEIITYLPTGAGADADSIELDILMASAPRSRSSRAAARRRANVKIEEVAAAGRAASVRVVTAVDSAAARRPSPRRDALSPTRAGRVDDHAARPTPLAERRPSSPRAPERGRRVSLRSVAQTVRVDIRKLDRLMNIVGELADRAHRARAARRAACAPSPASASSRIELHRLHRTLRPPPRRDAERHPRGADGPARPGLRQARARRPADLPRGRQAGQPGHHRRRDRGRQAHRRGAQRSAHAHDAQRHRSRRSRRATSARRSASRRSAPSRSTRSRRATTSSSRSRTTARASTPTSSSRPRSSAGCVGARGGREISRRARS